MDLKDELTKKEIGDAFRGVCVMILLEFFNSLQKTLNDPACLPQIDEMAQFMTNCPQYIDLKKNYQAEKMFKVCRRVALELDHVPTHSDKEVVYRIISEVFDTYDKARINN